MIRFLTSAVFLFFCSLSVSAETAIEGLKEIKALYEAKNFEKLIKERYSEIHKAKDDAEVEKIIGFMKKRFGNEKNLNMVLKIYEGAEKVEPVIMKNPSPNESEDENMAVFKIKFHGKELPFNLYQMKNGKWGFHF